MRWIARQQRNYALIALVTFTAPKTFLKWIYRHNQKPVTHKSQHINVTLSFDCDFPEDVEAIPGLIDLLKKYPYKASFACVGYWIEKYPKEHKMILDNGHEIINHTYTHPDNDILAPRRKFNAISRSEKAEEIWKCHETCRRVLNYEPKGFRAPHFKNLFTPELYDVLGDMGYLYSSSTWVTCTTSYGQPFRAKRGIIEFPLSNCPVHPFTVFDTWHSLNSKRLSHRLKHRGPEGYCNLFHELLTIGEETGAYLNVYLDPMDVKKITGFGAILDRLKQNNVFRVVTYEDMLQDFPAQINRT